jgi:hypothetical protein
MDFDDFLDPYRPFADEVDTLIALHDDASPDWTLRQFTPVFMNLFEDDRADLYAGDPPRDLAGRVRRFLDRVKHLSSASPTPQELDHAPTLHRWCAVRLGTSPFLLGQSTGHPLLKWGARTRTSVLMQISLDHSWARTWNRYYSLSEYNRETLFAMQADGKIPTAVELIPINDKLH